MPKIVDHDERRLVLADAVLAVVARQGVSAVTTRAVAEESGWSTGVLNHYFASRRELLLAALRRAGEVQGDLYAEILGDPESSPLDKLRTIATSILPLDERRLALTRVFLFFYAAGAAEDAAREEIAGFLARWRHVVRQTIVAAQDDGAISGDLDVDAVTIRLVAMIDGLSFEAILDPVVMEVIRAEDFASRCIDAAVQDRPRTLGAVVRRTDRVVVLDDFIPADVLADTFAEAGLSVEVVQQKEIPSGRGVVALLAGPETVGLGADHLAELPDLKLLSATSAGYDHLPVAAARERGLWVTRAVDYCTEEVADHALACTVGLLRSTHTLDAAVHSGSWDVTSAPPRRIAGTVLGLYGFGRIAQAFARRARALGMVVLVAGRGLSVRAGELDAAGVVLVEWDELLRRSDVVSLHVPLTPETADLIDAQALAAMQPGSFLINVSRGGLVDHDALAAALRSGHLAGAAVDVLPTEPPAQGDPVLHVPNLVITPHAAWYSPEVARTLARQSARSVIAVLTGTSPVGVVVAPGK